MPHVAICRKQLSCLKHHNLSYYYKCLQNIVLNWSSRTGTFFPKASQVRHQVLFGTASTFVVWA